MMRPRKRFGQHFLEPAWVEKVLEAIGPHSSETFLEIGPGRGALTRHLAAHSRRVIAFEIDRDLARGLQAAAPPNLTVIEGDFLDATTERLMALIAGAGKLRVAGNLPYNVASPMLSKLAELHADGLPTADATVMLQREVADRLSAVPGTRAYGVLTLLSGRRAAVERVLALPPGAFRPPPKVRSALVRLRFHAPEPPAKNEAMLTALVKSVFLHRRKMLINTLDALVDGGRLSVAETLSRAELDGRRRPETLTMEELVRLADALGDRS